MIPEELRYTDKHEWVAAPTSGTAVRVGITDFAQDALGDIVYVSLPAAGTVVKAGESMGEVESTKSVSEIYAPISGTVTAGNESLSSAPEIINSEPYTGGWMVEIEPSDSAEFDELLDAAGYAEAIGQG